MHQLMQRAIESAGSQHVLNTLNRHDLASTPVQAVFSPDILVTLLTAASRDTMVTCEVQTLADGTFEAFMAQCCHLVDKNPQAVRALAWYLTRYPHVETEAPTDSWKELVGIATP